MAFRSLMADTTALKHRDFRHLWIANIITVIGAQLNILAVPAQLYAITGNSGYVGLSGLFGLVPLVVFGLYGGALADIMDRRILLLITTSGLILSGAGFWLQAATQTNNVWLILSLLAIQQAFFAINQPTRTAIIPKLVGTANIASATSLNMTVMQLGAIAGPLVGGALIPVLGFSWLYFLDFLALFATLWAVYRLPSLVPTGASASASASASQQPENSTDTTATPRAGTRSVVAGLSFLLTQPILQMTFVIDLIAMIFGSPRALIPQISHVDFGEANNGGLMFALLFAALPIGAFVGGVFSGAVTRIMHRGLGVTIAVVVWGAVIVIMGIAVSLANGTVGLWAWVAFLAFAIGGAADMFSAVLRSTMLQEAADDAMRGRLQGVFIVVVAGGPRIGDVLHGGAGSIWSAGTVTTLGGVAVILGTILAVACVPRFLTWVPTHPTPQPAPNAAEDSAPHPVEAASPANTPTHTTPAIPGAEQPARTSQTNPPLQSPTTQTDGD